MSKKTVLFPFLGPVTWGRDSEEEIEARIIAEMKAKAPTTDDSNTKPIIRAGRSSVPEGETTLNSLLSQLGAVEPNFDVRFLEVLENLGMYNPDLSYAIDNIVQLGNTEYTIEFDEAVPEELAEEMKKHIHSKRAHWYTHSGGINSLINDLLAQIALTGALSAEVIPSKDLSGVDKSVLVNPKNIKFLYDKKKDIYKAYQQTPTGTTGSLVERGLKELNPVTYKYYAIRRFNERPYAIPPFMSALEHIAIERDMVDNLKAYVKKLGLFGFLQVLLTPPNKKSPQENGGKAESEAAYKKRLNTYLQESSDELDKVLSTGKMIGFKGAHETELSGVTQNGSQVKEVFDLVAEMKMAGLKQDPLMLGRQFNTSEAVGRVILAKLSTQITNYQALVSSFLCELFGIELQLAGYDYKEVLVTFEKPMITDESKEQEAFAKKIDNYDALYKQGVIDQNDRAQALGYEEAAEEEPRQTIDDRRLEQEAANALNAQEPDPTGTESKAANAAFMLRSLGEADENNLGLQIELYGYCMHSIVPEFDYHAGHTCNHDTVDFNLSADDADEAAREYANEMKGLYGKAIKKITKKVSDELGELGKAATLERVTDLTIYHLFKEFKTEFSDKQRTIIERWIKKSYKGFRASTSAFGPLGKKKIPKATFGVIDQRTLEYFAKSDGIYLGKFITDTDTKKKVFKFIKDKFVEGNLPLGKDKAILDAFRKEFGDLLQGEDYKILRIINTTVNTMKSYASINYFDQAGVQEYEIRGINDRLQCAYCAEMQGKRFSVAQAYTTVSEVVNSAPEFVKVAKPFITSVYKKPEDLANATEEEIMSNGVSLPAYHPGCRDRTIAVF